MRASKLRAHGLVPAASLGLAAGFLSGLFGVGGGILIVPGLVLALRFDQRLAHSTSLASVLPIAVAGTVGYAFEDSVDWPVAAALVAGAVIGAVIGTHWLYVLPTWVLAYAFAGVLVVSAARLVFHDPEGAARSGLGLAAIAALVVIGLVSGTLAGLLGVGGGVVMVPAMIIVLAIPAAVAKGTSLAVIVPVAVAATWRNRRNESVDLRIAAAVGLAGVVSAYAASSISVGLDERVSNALFAVLLTLVAVRMTVVTFRARLAERRPPDGTVAGHGAP